MNRTLLRNLGLGIALALLPAAAARNCPPARTRRIMCRSQPSARRMSGRRPRAYAFDRNTSFGFQNALSYQIVVSWMIGELKSQGLLQTMHNKDAKECFWVDNPDTPGAGAAVAALFQAITPAAPVPTAAR